MMCYLTENKATIDWNNETKTIWYRKYGSWETDAIIANEMFIGVGTAAGCIFCVTVIMINSFVTAVIVMLCCLLTLTFVGG